MNPFLMRRRMFMNEKNIEKLAYIQSTGTQLIDTEYIPKMNTVLEMDIQFVQNKYTDNPHLISTMANNFFGVSEEVNSFTVNFGGSATQKNELYFWNNIRGGTIRNQIYGAVTNRSIFLLKNNSATFQNVKTELTTKSGEHKETMALFGRKNRYVGASDVEVCFSRYDMRLYGCKIYEDDVLIKDFIPAKVGEKVGLYDNVSKKFHENKGTGEFLYAVKE